MIVVTGGAGFIGSNLIAMLNAKGYKNILVVDDLTDGTKFKNLADCDIADYLDKEEFLPYLQGEKRLNTRFDVIFHQGACSSTTEWDGRFMMQNNYEYSKAVVHYCHEHQTQLIYASSAAVYGGGTTFREERRFEAPLNVYGYSKFQFDQYIRQHFCNANFPIVGLRYFNVYGPREAHKGNMSSVAFHLANQLKEKGVIKLFEGCDGYSAGEQRRDFIYVNDVVDVNLWFWQNPEVSGIFNVGTGQSETFNAVAEAVLSWYQRGTLEYIPFPAHLRGCYQSFTEADITRLRSAGFNQPFKTVREGVGLYLDWLETSNQ